MYLYQDTSSESASERSFPDPKSSDTFYNDLTEYYEYTDDDIKGNLRTKDSEFNDSKLHGHSQFTNWKRYGQTIDRQFGLFSGIFNIAGIAVSSYKGGHCMVDHGNGGYYNYPVKRTQNYLS